MKDGKLRRRQVVLNQFVPDRSVYLLGDSYQVPDHVSERKVGNNFSFTWVRDWRPCGPYLIHETMLRYRTVNTARSLLSGTNGPEELCKHLVLSKR
jgi:hypothetical protein